jgi:hypothetical protein
MRKLIIVIPFLLLAATAWAQFEHPDFKSGKKHIQSVVLMPVQAEVSRLSMKGPEPMVEESRRVEKDLTPVIVDVLKKLGCRVNDTAATPEARADDPELKYVIDDLQKQFDATMEQMVRKSKDVRKGRFSLGDSVTKLPAGEDVDAILFVRAAGQVLTGGKKAFGLLIGGPAFDMVAINVGVVDAKSGDVLYLAKPFMLKNLAKDPADTQAGIAKSFKNFAKANASATPAPIAAISAPAFAKKPEPSAQPVAKLEAPPAPTEPPVAEEAVAPSLHHVSPQPATLTASTPKVYVFAQRTQRHIKYSDADVFDSAIKDINDYLKTTSVAVAYEVPGTLSHSEFTTPTDKILAAAKYTHAESVLYIEVDRPINKWIEFRVRCLDATGKELWNLKAGSGGGFTGAHGLQVGLEHLHTELDQRVGQQGIPLLEKPPVAQGK